MAARHAGVLLVGCICMCVQVLMSELEAAGFNIEWVHRPNGDRGS